MVEIPTTAETRLCLVRHGETEWNAERRIQGQIDIALNAVGLAQADAAGPLAPLIRCRRALQQRSANGLDDSRAHRRGLGLARLPLPNCGSGATASSRG